MTEGSAQSPAPRATVSPRGFTLHLTTCPCTHQSFTKCCATKSFYHKTITSAHTGHSTAGFLALVCKYIELCGSAVRRVYALVPSRGAQSSKMHFHRTQAPLNPQLLFNHSAVTFARQSRPSTCPGPHPAVWKTGTPTVALSPRPLSQLGTKLAAVPPPYPSVEDNRSHSRGDADQVSLLPTLPRVIKR